MYVYSPISHRHWPFSASPDRSPVVSAGWTAQPRLARRVGRPGWLRGADSCPGAPAPGRMEKVELMGQNMPKSSWSQERWWISVGFAKVNYGKLM